MELRDIPGYEGFYAVDREGSVYRTERYGRAILRKIALRPKNGYLAAHLCKDAQRCDFLAHRAVWLAFNGPIPEGLEINHKNGVRSDNRLVNLELMTRRQNAQHKFDVLGYRSHGRSLTGVRNHAAKLNEQRVREIRSLHATGRTLVSLAAQFGVTPVAIGAAVRRRTWKEVA